MSFRLICLGALSALCLSAGAPAQAGQCGYEKCWGAVGFGPGGAWGYVYGKKSRQAATGAVQKNCGGNCTQIKAFYNTCGAIAAGKKNGWGWGHAPTRAKAESIAMGYCKQYDSGCRIRAWACSP